MKKFLILLLTIFILIINFNFVSLGKENDVLKINAKSAVLMDVSTGKVLYSYNEHEKLYPASVTKVMSLLIFAEAIDSGKIKLEDEVTASSEASSKGGSQIWLETGETMTVNELMKAVAIASANDACCALSEHIAGSESAFVNLMNDRAKELGMNDTHFENCSGLDDEVKNHLTSAYDIAVMSKELLKHDLISKYSTVWMDSLRNGKTELVNTNKLVRFYNGTTGLKTGTTSKAGKCLSASAERNELHLVAVVMGSKTSDERFETAKELLDYGFANYETVTLSVDETLFTNVKVIRGIDEYVKPIVKNTSSVTLKKGDKDKISSEIILTTDVEAPVEEGQKLGTVEFKLGDEVIAQYGLFSENSVKKIEFYDVFIRLLTSIVEM